jgi:SAM-dependent methyltransferase
MKLNLGCGNKKKEGFIHVDRYACDAAEVICDIAQGLPFADDSIEEVWLDNVIEHILDIPTLMREIVRVSKNGAKVSVITPHFTSAASWRDPSHFHHLSYFSMDHFQMKEVAHYIGGGLRVWNKKLSFGGGLFGLIARSLFYLSPRIYEDKFGFIFRASTLRVELTVEKEALRKT